MFTRVRIIVLATLLSFNCIATDETTLTIPSHGPERIIELATGYLEENKEKVEWCDYSLEEVSFSYSRGEWWLMYECEEKRPGYHFGLRVTNEEKPEFTYRPGK